MLHNVVISMKRSGVRDPVVPARHSDRKGDHEVAAKLNPVVLPQLPNVLAGLDRP